VGDERAMEAMQRLGRRLSRLLAFVCFAFLLMYAAIGFVTQQRAAHRLSAEVAQRQQVLSTARREQTTLTAELSGLNDAVRYSQYSVLVGRHTLLLARPGETLVLVNWTSKDGRPISEMTTDWKALLHAAGIPTT